MQQPNERIAMRVSLVTIAVDIMLTIFKLFAGIVGRSTAMMADAVHTLSDMLTTVIVMIGIKLANRKPDKEHPYGHERFECVAAIILAVVLFVTGLGIGWSGVTAIFSDSYAIVPGGIALAGAIATLVIKTGMYAYKRAAAIRINSSALMADAWHHLTDSLSSIGSFLGILGARMGFPILDPVAAIVICLFVLKAALDIFRDAIGKMTDHACDEETEAGMRSLVLKQEAVVGIDTLQTRLFGDRIYVEVEISVDGTMPLYTAHHIAEQVHDAIETGFSRVKHCTVHVNPAQSEFAISE